MHAFRHLHTFPACPSFFACEAQDQRISPDLDSNKGPNLLYIQVIFAYECWLTGSYRWDGGQQPFCMQQILPTIFKEWEKWQITSLIENYVGISQCAEYN